MGELVSLGVKAGIRGVGLRVLLMVAGLVLAVSLLASGFSGRQPTTVALDVGLSGLRFAMLILVLLWVQDLFARDIERKTVYFVLAYPITRWQYLLSRFITVALLALLALVVIGGLLWLSLQREFEYTQFQPVDLGGKYLLVLLSIWLDALVVCSFALFLASLSTTPFLPLLLGFAFGLAARGLGPALDFLHGSRSDPLHVSLFGPVLEYSYVWLPDLSRLDWRPLALYDLPVPWYALGLAVINALGFAGIMLGLAALIFQRRNFT
ncbi:ABC transporter permease [Pseudomonas sp. F(2018)]|uniref:ABC transporter permease n=1 Tax=Pseudomonas sp. F(2018) TaxID=2502240 RepID=UPI0010F84C97|nr:ABC transporter permease subunit [Pseudomonas sp. F(2018)]